MFGSRKQARFSKPFNWGEQWKGMTNMNGVGRRDGGGGGSSGSDGGMVS